MPAVLEEEPGARSAPPSPSDRPRAFSEVVAHSRLRPGEKGDGERVADQVDAVQDGHRKPPRAVVEAAVDDPVRKAVAHPFRARAQRRAFRTSQRDYTIRVGMNVLLVRPDPGNERFGLGPFFRVEPLGLEYIGAALRERGHAPAIADLRFGRGLASWIRRDAPARRRASPGCTRSNTTGCSRPRGRSAGSAPEAFILVGGHAAAAYPAPLERDEVDAICVDDGEEVVPALADALEAGRSASDGAGALRLRTPDGWISTAPLPERTGLDRVPRPARDLVERYRNRYHCLLFKPVWLIETARGCPFRCNFCSVWQLYDRSFRERSIGGGRRGLRRGRRQRLRRGRPLLEPSGAQPRARGGAEEARRAQALAPRADAHGPRVPASGSAGSLAPAREGLRHLLRPRGRLRRGPRRAS